MIEKINFSKEQNSKLIQDRRWLHMNPELGFDLPKTCNYVTSRLKKLGVKFTQFNSSIICVEIGKGSKTLVLRADMDALNVTEETNIDFASTNGNMHACGHDFHTAILLSVAEILNENKEMLKCKVKLIFQPAEEIVLGAKAVIDEGLLDDVDNALMLHCYPSLDVTPGTLVVPDSGFTTLATEFFKVTVEGKGGHGAMPENTIDPIVIASHIILNLMNISSREISALEPTVVTVGKLVAGSAANVIPTSAVIEGSIRTFSQKNTNFIHSRIKEISNLTAQLFRGTCKVDIFEGCKSVYTDKKFIEKVIKIFQEEQIEYIDAAKIFNKGKFLFGEDFSFISEKVPSAILLLATGTVDDGYTYPLHHCKAIFDEKALIKAVKALVSLSLNYY